MKLIIGNKNYSSWSLRPWLLLKHFNIEFDEEQHDLYTKTYESEVAKYDTDYKVPILKDGDLLVWDSLSILEYISEQYLDGKGWPSNTEVRAVARSISHEMHSSFTNIRNEMPMNCRKSYRDIALSHESQQEIERIKSIWQRCRDQYGSQGEWLFGDFSIADAMFAPIAIRFNGFNIALNALEKNYVNSQLNHPHLQKWIKDGKQETTIIKIAEISDHDSSKSKP